MSRISRSRMSRRNSRSRMSNLAGGGNYTSAATYGEYVNQGTNAQFGRVFDQGNFPSRDSNVIIGAQGQWGNTVGTPSAQNLSLIQRAGKKTKKRRGGFLGPVINQAIVPFSLLAMQQSFRRKKGGKSRVRRYM